MLGEHMSIGRLTVDEYGERAARASAAKTRGDLNQLFADLPQPHPRLDLSLTPQPAAAAVEPAAPDRRPDRARDRQPLTPRIASALVPLSALVAVALFFGLNTSWIVFLIPAAVAVLTGALWGEHNKKHKQDRHRT